MFDTNAFENILKNHRKNVEKMGVSIQFVGPESDGSLPPFTYTIGLAKHGYPDLYIAGAMEPQTIAFILNQLYSYWSEHGFTLGEVNGILGNNLGLMLLPIVDASKMSTGVNRMYYEAYPDHIKRSPELPLFVQVLWPDTEGKYPTEDGYNTDFIQPVYATKLN